MLKKTAYTLLALVLLFGLLMLNTGFQKRVKKTGRSLVYRYNGLFHNETSWLLHSEMGHGYNLVTAKLLSPAFKIDRIYKSMRGPLDQHLFKLTHTGSDSLVWIKSYSVEVLDHQGKDSRPLDFMCHNNLDFNAAEYIRRMGFTGRTDLYNTRLITLTEGQSLFELPDGFGLPVFSDQLLTVQCQALNLNKNPVNLSIRHMTSIGFYQNVDAASLKPLFTQNIYITVPVSGNPAGICANGECLPALAKPELQQKGDLKYTGHWIIKTGRDTFRSEVTPLLNLPFTTTVHYIGAHVHPFAETLTLRDLTTGEVLFTAHMQNCIEKIGLEKIEHYSSSQGIPIFADHKYEMICTTNNTSGTDQDMMATMFLYMYDKELDQKLHQKRTGP